MRKYCMNIIPKLQLIKGLSNSVYVVPGFESFHELKVWPKTRKDVYKMSKVDLLLQPVHADKLASAHAAVDYDRWYSKLFFQIRRIVCVDCIC